MVNTWAIRPHVDTGVVVCRELEVGTSYESLDHVLSCVPNMPVVIGLDQLMGQLREQHLQHQADLAAQDRQHQDDLSTFFFFLFGLD
jgi:hypothetical protein